MDFYQPTFLFRQNAIRRPLSATSSPYISGNSSCESLTSSQKLSSWLLNNSNTGDMEIMNKACSLDRVNIKSNYWKIPDVKMNLTALAASNQFSDLPLLAISSANSDQNLFIYELDSLHHYLTHHTTISLPNIHGLAWVPNCNLKYLVTGNNKGYAHLVSVPLPNSYGGDQSDELAEIIKRFNHRKHLKSVNKDPSIHTHANSCVSKLGFFDDNSLISVYDDTLFVWDMNRCESSAKPRPLMISVVPGISNFDCRLHDSSMLAISGSFGVSLYDTRTRIHNVPNAKVADNMNPSKLSANIVKWHPTDERLLATAHGDGVVRLWDVRKEEPFCELTGHRNKTVTALQWNHNDIFTGASDGNIVHWDLTTDINSDLTKSAEALRSCSLKEGLKSVSFDAIHNTLVDSLSERQCGTKLPALNNLIIGMCQVSGSDGRENPSDCEVISIDGSAFLGLHSKIYDAVNMEIATGKMYYSPDDLTLMSKDENSNSTLVASSDELSIKPLEVSRKSTFKLPNLANSSETINDVEELDIHASLGKYSHCEVESDNEFHFNFNSAALKSLNHRSSRLPTALLPSLPSLPLIPSYASLPETRSSPTASEKLGNESIYTLSTNATQLDECETGLTKTMLLSFLDSELDKICAEFQNHTQLLVL